MTMFLSDCSLSNVNVIVNVRLYHVCWISKHNVCASCLTEPVINETLEGTAKHSEMLGLRCHSD